MGQPPDAVAHRRRALELQRLRRLLHLRRQRLLHGGALAGEERLRLPDQRAIRRFVDPSDAGRGAAADLIQQAGAAAIGEHRVGAGAQQEHALHRRHRLVHRPGGGERAEIAALARPRAAMLRDLRERVVLGQHQPRVALVVAQDDVEARLQALDQVGLEQQRLGLGMGGDDLHRRRLGDHPPQPLRQARGLGVGRDPLLQRPRLADVERLAAWPSSMRYTPGLSGMVTSAASITAAPTGAPRGAPASVSLMARD